MIIGLVLCALAAVVLLFKTDISGKRKVAYTLFIGALIASPFIPTLTAGDSSLNLGVIAIPILLGFSLMFFMKLRSELLGVLLSAVVVISLTVAVVFLTYAWQNPYKDLTVAVCVGILSGCGAYLVTKRALPSVSATLIGVPLGDLTSSLITYYFLDGEFIIGSGYLFDAVMIAAVLAAFLAYAIVELTAWRSARRMEKAENFEAAIDYAEFSDEYKKYFGDE